MNRKIQILGTVIGLTNCIGSIPGFVAPAVASTIINGDASNISKWRNVWIIAIVIFMVETVTFIIFADGKPQKWNAPTGEKTKEGKDWILVRFVIPVFVKETDTFRFASLLVLPWLGLYMWVQ